MFPRKVVETRVKQNPRKVFQIKLAHDHKSKSAQGNITKSELHYTAVASPKTEIIRQTITFYQLLKKFTLLKYHICLIFHSSSIYLQLSEVWYHRSYRDCHSAAIRYLWILSHHSP